MLPRTMFDTPVIAAVFRGIAVLILKLTGWKVEGTLPAVPKFVLIAAPHTSVWDGFYMILVAFVFRVKMLWMGKHTLFKLPFGPLVRWLGGIPVTREVSGNMVQQAIRLIEQSETIVLAVPPEGTRQRVAILKTGFYYIALGAKVPIVLGFLDYRRKISGVGPTLMPSGDLAADLKTIRAFYSTITGKHKHNSAWIDPDQTTV